MLQQKSILKVSVCVITYNHGYWLRECLQSIVDQITDFQFEVIVGDDCSTDGISKDVLQEFASKYPDLIVPLFREANMGGHGTQNWFDVMNRARGEYIAHIDGDDRMLPGKLQKGSDFLDQHSDCAIVAHDLRTFDGETGNILAENFTTFNVPEITDMNFLVLHRCYFGHSSKMFRRSAMITRNREMPTTDYYLHIEHASKGKIGYLNEVLGEYRKSTGSNTTSQVGIQHELEIGYHDAFDRALTLGVDQSIVTKGRLGFNYSLAYKSLLANDRSGFKKYIYLDSIMYQHAMWKHRLFYKLRYCPALILMMIDLKLPIYQAISKINKLMR